MTIAGKVDADTRAFIRSSMTGMPVGVYAVGAVYGSIEHQECGTIERARQTARDYRANGFDAVTIVIK